MMEKETTPLFSDDGRVPPSDDNIESLWTLIKQGVVLTNTGSTARDHLANERTYLAWMRTALALIGASLGLLKWDAVSNTAGYLVAILGMVVLMGSTHRYFRVMQMLERGKFEPNVHSILAVVTVALAAIVAAFVLHYKHQL